MLTNYSFYDSTSGSNFSNGNQTEDGIFLLYPEFVNIILLVTVFVRCTLESKLSTPSLQLYFAIFVSASYPHFSMLLCFRSSKSWVSVLWWMATMWCASCSTIHPGASCLSCATSMSFTTTGFTKSFQKQKPSEVWQLQQSFWHTVCVQQ